MSAGPHAYPASTCSTLSVSTQNPLPGAAITVSGSGFAARASVHLVLSNRAPSAARVAQQRADATVRAAAAARTYDLGTVTTNASGSFTARITLPSSITNAGRYYLIALTGFVGGGSCNADPYQVLDIQVAGVSSAGPTPSTGGTAFTGLNVAALIALGLVLIGAGTLFVRRGGSLPSRT